MTPLRIFISSVQGEFAHERAALRDYICSDDPTSNASASGDQARPGAGHRASRPAVGIRCHAGAGWGASGRSRGPSRWLWGASRRASRRASGPSTRPWDASRAGSRRSRHAAGLCSPKRSKLAAHLINDDEPPPNPQSPDGDSSAYPRLSRRWDSESSARWRRWSRTGFPYSSIRMLSIPLHLCGPPRPLTKPDAGEYRFPSNWPESNLQGDVSAWRFFPERIVTQRRPYS